MRALRSPRRAAVTVEFALTLPVLLMLLAGVLDYGWFFFVQVGVQSAAADAVRMGVDAAGGVDPGARAEAAAGEVLEDAGLPCLGACAITGAVASESGYRLLRVVVDRPFEPLVGLVPSPTANHAVCTMLLEQQDTGFYSP
ncbi:MAG: TadE/TadG family type IV pilus assembly protein [Pseudomonadota bacterium]